MATAAGYILVDSDKIWGIGETVAQAQYDARREGEYLDHDGEELDDWIYSLRALPATAALMEAARYNRFTSYRKISGGFWSTGIWGTQAEYEALQ